MYGNMIVAQTAKIIGELVLSLHASRSSDLTFILPPECCGMPEEITAYFSINGNTAYFTSIEERNSFLASYLFEKHREEFKSNLRQWLQTAHDVWRHEIGSSDSVAGRLLALVHDSEDILLIATSAIADGGIEVF